LEQGQPLLFGENNELGIRIDGLQPRIVNLEKEGLSADDLWIHDETNAFKAQILTHFFDDPRQKKDYFPRPFGVLYTAERPCYEDLLFAQLDHAVETQGKGDLNALIAGNQTWEIV